MSEESGKQGGEKRKFRTSDRAWVERKLIFGEDIHLSAEDILEHGATLTSAPVRKTVLERYTALTGIEVTNTLALAHIVREYLEPDMQEFFQAQVHPGRTFSTWIDEIPLAGTRRAGGKECTVTFTDFNAMRLLVEKDGSYHINPEVARAFSPAIEMHYQSAETGEGTITFNLSHGDPGDFELRAGEA